MIRNQDENKLGRNPVSEATNRAKELRAELAEAEKTAKAEAAADLQAARERWKAEEVAKTDAYRNDNYEIFVGGHRNYVGASTTHNGGVEIDITEYTLNIASVSLTREETLALIEGLKTLVK